MSNKVTVEEAERMIMRLPLSERVKLAARICEEVPSEGIGEDAEREEAESGTTVDQWLADCDAIAETVEGEFDSATELVEIREERANSL